MSSNLLESLWTRIDTRIGSRITQISELLTQALSANTESVAARDIAVAAEQTASTAATNAASSESVAKSAETAAAGYAETAQTSATEAVDAKNRAVEIAGGDFATLEYVDDLAVKIDTSRGYTRAFVGDTMIYGNTGVRVVRDLVSGLDCTQRNHHNVYIMREGDTVTLWGVGYNVSELHLTGTLPMGFKPILNHYMNNVGTAYGGGNYYGIGCHNTWTRLTYSGGIPPQGLNLGIQASWVTGDPWPTALPGTPA